MLCVEQVKIMDFDVIICNNNYFSFQPILNKLYNLDTDEFLEVLVNFFGFENCPFAWLLAAVGTLKTVLSSKGVQFISP